MLISAKEFIDKSLSNGLSRHDFKRAFCNITDETVPIDQIIKDGNSVFFAINKDYSYLRYFTANAVTPNEGEKELCSDAFKILKLLAD